MWPTSRPSTPEAYFWVRVYVISTPFRFATCVNVCRQTCPTYWRRHRRRKLRFVTVASCYGVRRSHNMCQCLRTCWATQSHADWHCRPNSLLCHIPQSSFTYLCSYLLSSQTRLTDQLYTLRYISGFLKKYLILCSVFTDLISISQCHARRVFSRTMQLYCNVRLLWCRLSVVCCLSVWNAGVLWQNNWS